MNLFLVSLLKVEFKKAFTVHPPAIMTNVQVRQILDSDNSVLITWDKITLTNITEYTVIYSPVSSGGDGEMTLSVASTESSVIISGLMDGVEYQFQVETVGEFGRMKFNGSRTEASMVLAPPSNFCDGQPSCESKLC